MRAILVTRARIPLFENGYHRQVAEQSWRDEALARLRGAGGRSGGARRAVVDFLARQDCCRTAQEIFDGIRAGGGRVGIASVYRALERLTEARLVQRVEIGDGLARYEATRRDGARHHHHLVCDDCGRVEPFADAALERALARTAGRLGVGMDAHEVVLHGSCDDCRAA
jgi:Fur family ferric uptake transcriptional regulator